MMMVCKECALLASVGIFLVPTATERLSDLACNFKIFALHTSVPFVRESCIP